ncbi:MAG: SdiA-regulated domain-containing protein [Phycisphaerae bacterium]|nr:SdiA-regulated domain-containing protein [Phycisphaerae bacterium]
MNDASTSHSRLKTRGFTLAALLVGAMILAWTLSTPLGRWSRHHDAEVLPADWTFTPLPVREPSSIVYHPRRGTLFVASDSGYIAELDLDLRLLDRYGIPGDLEGLAVHPETGTLLVAVESYQAVLEYDVRQRRIIRCLEVDLQSHPCFAMKKRHDNRGLEGIAVIRNPLAPPTLVAVVQADPARLVTLDADLSRTATERARAQLSGDDLLGVRQRAAVRSARDLGMPLLSDVLFDHASHRLCVLCSKDAVLIVADPDGAPLRKIRLPGAQPEGLVFAPDGRALLVDDRAGGVWMCPDYRTRLFGDRVAGQTPSPKPQKASL